RLDLAAGGTQMLPLVVALDGRGARPPLEEVKDFPVGWTTVDKVADGDNVIVVADAGTIEQVEQLLITGVNVSDNQSHVGLVAFAFFIVLLHAIIDNRGRD